MNHGDLEKLRDALSKLQKLAAGGRNPQSASLEKGWATGGRTVNDPLKTQVAKEFDESKHPRSADGKFGEGGGSPEERVDPGTGGANADQAASRWRAGTERMAAESPAGRNAPATAEKIKSGLDYPYVNTRTMALGGEDRASVAITVSLDVKEKWENGILENSRYGKFMLDHEGKLEHISGHGIPKVRSTRVKTAEQAISYLKDKIGKAEEAGDVNKADYDESKHERDDHGRFSGSGGGEGGAKESLESKQERLQSRLQNEGMHQSDALDEVASMSEEQIDERLGTSSDEGEDQAAAQEVDAEAQAQQEGREYTEENYQSDIETLRSNRQHMDAKEYNEAVDRLAEGTGKSHDEIKGDIGATQDTGVDTNSPPSVSSPAEFGRRAEARADKYGYFGTATARDPRNDQYVVDRISRGLNQGPEKTEMILASAYGRHLADALHHTAAGLDRAKLVDRTVKEFNSKIGTKISSWGEFFKPEKSEKMVKGDWDESKHPRGDDGKFGEGGGSRELPSDAGKRGAFLYGEYGLPKLGSHADFYDKNGDKQYGKVTSVSGTHISFSYKEEDTGNKTSIRLAVEPEGNGARGESAEEQQRNDAEIDEARATDRQQEDSRQAQAEREADEDMEARRHEPYSQDLQEDGYDSEDERDNKDEEDPDVDKVADLMRAVVDVINKQYFSLNKYIRQHGGKWTVYSEAGKPMGTYDSESGAKHRLQQIEYFKHRKDFGFNDLVKGIKHTTEALSQVIEEMNQQEAGKELAPEDVKQLEEIIDTLNGIVNYLYESKERGHLKP